MESPFITTFFTGGVPQGVFVIEDEPPDLIPHPKDAGGTYYLGLSEVYRYSNTILKQPVFAAHLAQAQQQSTRKETVHPVKLRLTIENTFNAEKWYKGLSDIYKKRTEEFGFAFKPRGGDYLQGVWTGARHVAQELNSTNRSVPEEITDLMMYADYLRVYRRASAPTPSKKEPEEETQSWRRRAPLREATAR